MKLGVCCTTREIPLVRELGFDYIEGNLSAMATATEEDYRALTETVEREGFPVEACNCFFPNDMSLYPTAGRTADDILRTVAAYASRGLSRAAAWGVQIAVLGSGRVRTIPGGMETDAAAAHFSRILAVCGEAADRHGIRVCIEPLSRNETNFIHTVAEGASMARTCGHPAVGVMVDFFHLWANGDELASLPAVGNALMHAHIARPGDRRAPTVADIETLRAWAHALAACPSVERLSLECVYHPDVPTALRAALRASTEVLRLFR